MTNIHWCLLGIFLVFTSCKDPFISDADRLISNIDAGGVSIFTDQFAIRASTVYEDPLRADGLTSINRFMLGNMDDPIFGQSYAGIYLQLSLPVNSLDLGDALQLDSVVLSLDYLGFYGNAAAAQNVLVFPLEDDMDITEEYLTDRRFQFASFPIGEKRNFVPDLTSTLNILGDSAAPAHLRIRLNDSFGQLLLDQSGGAHVANNAAFLDFFPGLYLSSDTNLITNGMIYFDLNSVVSNLTLYYRNNLSDALSFTFEIDASTAKNNHFRHEYTTRVKDAIDMEIDSVLYVQSMAGVKAKIEIPGLKNLGRVVVNKAELVFTIAADPTMADTSFGPPAQMYLLRSDAEGKNDFISDLFEGTDYYGGFKIVELGDKGQLVSHYRFNIALNTQQIIDGTFEDYGLYLITFPSSQIGDRVIIQGAGSTADSIKLNLTYTRLPE